VLPSLKNWKRKRKGRKKKGNFKEISTKHPLLFKKKAGQPRPANKGRGKVDLTKKRKKKKSREGSPL